MKINYRESYSLLLAFALILIPHGGGLKAMPRAYVSFSPNALQVDTVHTPAPGSPERQAIMDALREHNRKNLGEVAANTRFEVSYLKVHNGWAWVIAKDEGSNDPGSTWDAMLHMVKGKWTVVDVPWGPDELDEDLLVYGKDHSKYAQRTRRIRKVYPSAPADIFPQP